MAAATLGMLLSGLTAYVVVRTRDPLRKPLDLVSWLPWAIPGIVMGLGLLWAYVFLQRWLPVTLYGSIGLLVLAFVTVGLPLGVRVMMSTMIQISSDLEEIVAQCDRVLVMYKGAVRAELPASPDRHAVMVAATGGR